MPPIELRFSTHAYVAAAPYIAACEHPNGTLEAHARSFMHEAIEVMIHIGPRIREDSPERWWVVDARGMVVMAYDTTNPIPHRRLHITAQAASAVSRLPGVDTAAFEQMELLVIEREVLMGAEHP